MNIEDCFAKEFRLYQEYKARILNGVAPQSDPDIERVLSSVPYNTAMGLMHGLHSQLDYLRGVDLGCTVTNGRVQPSDFLSRILPPTMPRRREEDAVQFCLIKGIKEPFFDKLNKTTVVLRPRVAYSKRVTGDDGQHLVDQDGKVVSQDIPIPVGSRVVSSSVNIHLPKRIETETGRLMRHIPEEGYGFLDYVKEATSVSYLYHLPREVIYPMNLNCLLLTTSRLTSRYYWGREYTFNRGISTAYMYVVPYTQSILKPGNVVFCLKASDDFQKEVGMLEEYWQVNIGANGMPQPSVIYPFETMTSNDPKTLRTSADGNLAFRTLTAPESKEYVKYDNSLAEDLEATYDTGIEV